MKKIVMSKAIRNKCIEYAGDSPKEVTLCHIFDCPLWPFRFGCYPNSSQYEARMNKALDNLQPEFEELVRMGIDITDFIL